MSRRGSRRRLLAPEVVQTSAMDCGPAALKSLLEGHGIAVSYGRLREACQTEVDGTSIDTLEEVARQLGLDAEQVMVPVDHLLVASADALPGVVVLRQPSGATHFVVVWRRHGGLVQLMDPAFGRRWTGAARLLRDVYVHTATLPLAQWREWAGSDDFLNPLRERLARVGARRGAAADMVAAAVADPGWHRIGALDAATRMIAALVASGGLRRGGEASRALAACVAQVSTEPAGAETTVPDGYWSVRPAPAGDDGEAQLRVRGAVVVRIGGRRPVAAAGAEEVPPLAPELAAALREPPARPGRELLRLLRADGLLVPAALLAALVVAAAGAIVQAVLLRALFGVGRELGVLPQRIAALGAVGLFAIALLLLDLAVVGGLLRAGRRLEARLRVAFLRKVPRLGDRYFRSRPVSDMAERQHALHQLRAVPPLAGRLIQLMAEVVVTAGAIVVLAPSALPLAAVAAGLALCLPFLFLPPLVEADLRVRTHLGSLSRFYLDALLGLVAVRTHDAARALRREHEGLLLEWARARFLVQRRVALLEGAQALAGLVPAALLLRAYVSGGGHASGALLLVLWTLNLPLLGQEIALLYRQYPAYRNVTMRFLEPLGAPEEEVRAPVDGPPAAAASGGRHVCLEGVTVRAGGHVILRGVDLTVAAGEHVAIVGASGAGKSSLVGLLLGWHRPAEGRVLVDGRPLGEQLDAVRGRTAWLEPAVQLWNRTLLENLRYGAPLAPAPLGQVMDDADLRQVLEALPAGMQTSLGEGGGLVSGGEGQRVRFGRALLRGDARLVVLDEPFRGLDRAARRALQARTRTRFRAATLLCVSHDVADTASYDRVLVLDGGQVIEDGPPAALAARPASRYRALLEAERLLDEELWQSPTWRRLRLERGKIVSGTAATGEGSG